MELLVAQVEVILCYLTPYYIHSLVDVLINYMKKIIIQYNEFILRVSASENNIHIENSYRVKRSSDMKNIIYIIRDTFKDLDINKRSIGSIINEWRVHNLLYSLNIYRDRTKDVDLEYPQSWYIKVLYTLLSPLYL